MGLYRCSRAPLRVRIKSSCWTSIGIVALLTVGVSCLFAWQSLNDYFEEAPSLTSAAPRNLKGVSGSHQDSGGYWDDALIDKPYNKSDKKYMIFVHIIVIGYMLLGLNTVCDLYFTGALDEMVNKWKIKPDVAGATFMAAGGSAPELFTSLIGACVSESDVGFGTIVGSAVFNVLFVIGLCGFAAKEPISLTWWPLARDCTYYIFGLSVLAVFAKTNDNIELWEACILFLGYIGYCVLMYFNPNLEAIAYRKEVVEVTAVVPVTPVAADTGGTVVSTSEREAEKHHIKKSQPHFERKAMKTSVNGSSSDIKGKEGDEEADGQKEDGEDGLKFENIASMDTNTSDEEDDIEALLLKPDGTVPQILWALCMPVYVALYYLTPKPTEKWFLATFVVSLGWIAGFSFFLVYCVEILGDVLGIPIIVMGFTLLAAGTSIPDLVSSMAVARAGEGDMAVSSSIGSNIFDILVGLPIPWAIKILFVEMIGKGKDDFTVQIMSEYIVLYVLILVFMVFCVIASIHLLGWQLNRVLGFAMAALYAVFLIIVLSVEYSEPEALKF